ncbi:AzlC family ABC transporter permease [Thiomonas sp.]|jgi:4-azaleucine resistance transporter AzlC|uniref:AzlC family ABC transporter permease n=1 Tax=Thiomonas sp. TaxID=2047785 RepID=UPI002610B881|nr:AzlC family ABC transporter permease [Thiomonas sp.]
MDTVSPRPAACTAFAREALHGARDTVPLLLGAAPFGLIFGALAAASPLGVGGALAMSALVFAGSAQFIALSLLSGGAAGWVVVLTTWVVNLRHLLYAASLQRGVARLPQRWRLLLAFWLTDETYATVYHRYQHDGDGAALRHWYTAGSGAAMYVNWLGWTAAGALLGQASPALTHLGLEFALVATFVGIVAPLLRQRTSLAVALTAAAVALTARGLPYKLGLLAAALAGVAVGVWLDARNGSGQ